MPGSAHRLRLRLAAVAFALGETIELQHDVNVIRQHRASIRRRRPPRLSATTACFRCAADVAAFVKRDADFKPPVRHWVSSRIVPRTEAVHRMPVACRAGCKARTRLDEGAILR